MSLVVIISDVHANENNLRKALDIFTENKVKVILSAGDVVRLLILAIIALVIEYLPKDLNIVNIN